MMSKEKVLVTRDLPGKALDDLGERFEIDLPSANEPIGREKLLEHIVDKTGILCLLSDRIDEELMDKALQLKVISVCAAGYNNVNVAKANEKGIMVTNTPGVLAETTADLTWALLLAAARRIPEGDLFMRAAKFSGWSPTLLLGQDVHHKTIGIVGMGEIGSAVARRAKGFGMRILYHNRQAAEMAEELGAELVSLDMLLEQSDFVSIHVPLNSSTHHLIGKREIGRLKPSAILVNASRGEVIDEDALVAALREKRIAAAALDVFENEPKMAEGLAELENVVLTPHIGSASIETREKMAQMAVKNMIDALEGRRPLHLVNPGALIKR
jgi:glyoxylate reductase